MTTSASDPINQPTNQPTNVSAHPIAEHHRRRAAWLRRESVALLEEAEWHDRHAAQLETIGATDLPPAPASGRRPRPPFGPAAASRRDAGGGLWQTLLGAVVGGLVALWWGRRGTGEPAREAPSDRAYLRASVLDDVAVPSLPSRLPECCVDVLARPGWYDRDLLHSVKIRPANRFVRAISDPRVAGTEIAATTIGDTIYFRQPERFDPDSPEGLALLAHEIRHVEQYAALGGILGFALHYVRQFWGGGYGTNISFEDEAYAIQRVVADHLRREFTYNEGRAPCLATDGGRRPNPQYVSLQSYPGLDRWATGGRAMV